VATPRYRRNHPIAATFAQALRDDARPKTGMMVIPKGWRSSSRGASDIGGR
jgi:hypothetical protein